MWTKYRESSECIIQLSQRAQPDYVELSPAIPRNHVLYVRWGSGFLFKLN